MEGEKVIHPSSGEQKPDMLLFYGCVASLTATSFGFVLRAFVLQDWGAEFQLTQTQLGEIDLANSFQTDANGLPMVSNYNAKSLKNDQGILSATAFTPDNTTPLDRSKRLLCGHWRWRHRSSLPIFTKTVST